MINLANRVLKDISTGCSPLVFVIVFFEIYSLWIFKSLIRKCGRASWKVLNNIDVINSILESR